MRLKSLVIQGFKSFADKVVLEFQPGVNGIVGPNGCGKSNVVDAIRWVMGEQSPRSLRGAEMMDVVFGGTERRPPVGFARVQMLLEPDENDGPGSAAEAWAGSLDSHQEIEISRRLARNGESQYLLNRARCRLRDITELLLESRLGSREYSVIEQGKIDRLLSLRPAERLQVFEEAAGVRRFHLQRERTEAKLAHSLENLERAASVHAELEAQTRHLEQQAASARRYRDLGEALDRARVDLYVGRRERLRTTERIADSELSELLRTEDELGAALGTLQRDLRVAEAELMRHQNTRSGHEADLRSIESSLQSCRTEARVLAEAEPQLQAQIARAEVEQSRLGDRAAQLLEELARCSEDEMRLSEEIDRSGQDLSVAQAELERRRQQLSMRESEALSEQHKYVALHARHASATGERKRLEEALEREERLHQRVTKSLAELLDQERRLVEARSGLGRRLKTADEQLLGRKDQIRDLQERHSVASGRLRASQVELHGVEKRAEGLAARLRTLEELARALEGVGDGPRAVLQWAAARGEKAPLLLQCLDIPPDLESALTAALGDRLEAVVSPSLSWTHQAIDRIGADLCPTAFVVRDQLPAEPPVAAEPDSLLALVRWLRGSDPRLAAVLAHVRVAPDRATALQLLSSLAPGQVLVTGTGEAYDGAGLVSAGTQRSRAGLELRRVQEARRLTALLSDLSAQRQAIADRIRIHEEEVLAVAVQLESAEADRSAVQAVRAELAMEIERLEFQLERLYLDRTAMEQQLAHLASQLGSFRSTLEGLGAEIGRIEVTIADAESAERIRSDELAAARAAIQAFEQEELVSRRIESRSLRERLRGVTDRAVEVQRRAVEAGEERDRRDLEAGDGRARLETVRHRLSELRSLEESMARDREQIAAQMEEADTLCQVTSQALSGHRSSASDLDRHRQRLNSARAQLQIRLAESRASLEALESSRASLPERLLAEEPNLEQVPPEKDVETRIALLEQQQKDLGPLNFAAIEEFETCRQRLDFLSGQKLDLERSVQDLRQAIAQLTQRAATQFSEAFESIRTNFRSLFSQVLRGGTADLLLMASEHGPGVEIRAQPPGKKVRSIELLSGGEKALVTILVLVSMFLFRPSSFCILDEVDAPLDDLNNRRFVELLTTIARTTQVLVVTHSKHTIEACHALYGVTMDEPGVSKLVSVRLEARPENGR
jgi:chromosome segregation protein